MSGLRWAFAEYLAHVLTDGAAQDAMAFVAMCGLTVSATVPVYPHSQLAGSRPPDPRSPVVADGTLRTQRTVRSTLAEIAAAVVAAGIRPPAIVVIGPVVALHAP